MTNSRQDEIEKAAIDEVRKAFLPMAPAHERGFAMGAKWADENQPFQAFNEFMANALTKENLLLRQQLAIAKEALENIKALTHSWVMAEQTINCEHTYSKIRLKADYTLAKISEVGE